MEWAEILLGFADSLLHNLEQGSKNFRSYQRIQHADFLLHPLKSSSNSA
jgi:hypothetical protein